MKIGIFDPYLNTLGGGEKYMLTLAICLAKKNDVFIFWDSDVSEIQKIASERFNFDFNNISFVKNIFSPKVSLLNRVKEASKYDAIIYLSDGSIPFTFKRNLIIHFQFPVEWVKTNTLVKTKFLQVKKVICNSYFTKRYIDKKFGITSEVLYPPVSYKTNIKNKKENIILHVGRFGMDKEGSNYKKQDIMINIFKKMAEKELMDWKFILVISIRQEDKEKLENLIRMSKGFPIEFLINPSNEVLWEMYGKAKIYWHASGFGEDLEKHPEKAEHFGIATAEAMGAGAVPVVLKAGGQGEIVREGENGFLWSSIDECIKKTIMLMNDNVLRECLSNKGKEDAKRFNVERFSREVEDLIQ